MLNIVYVFYSAACGDAGRKDNRQTVAVIMTRHPAGKKNERGPTPRERSVGWFVMAVLSGIALSLAFLQGRYEPQAWRAGTEAVAEQPLTRDDASGRSLMPTPDVRAISAPEVYDKVTLSDKINGKAELYLAAGFVRLETHRFGMFQGGDLWMERYVYDMGRHANAFAVFSAQRRPNSESLALTKNAYRSANGLFFVHGRYYVEIIGASDSEALQKGMHDVARAFVQAHPVQSEELSEKDLLPTAHRVENSLALTAENVFGIDGLSRIYTAQYRRGEHEAIGFLSRRETPEQATRLASVFADFFMEYGGEERTSPEAENGMRVISLFDTYEVVLSLDAYLIGAHEATDLNLALDLVRQMRDRIEGQRHDR